MNIELHIEEIVLRGLEVRSRARVAEAIERELARLLQAKGISAQQARSAAIRQVRAPSFQVSPAGGDEKLAGEVAKAAHGAIVR